MRDGVFVTGGGSGTSSHGDARDVVVVPWFAWPVPPGERNPALRPVRDDEVEELDDVGPDDDWLTRAEPPLPRPRAGASEGATFVSRELGRALKERRWELHLSQRVYARRTGRAQGTVSKLERGLLSLTVGELIALVLETGRVVRLHVLPDGAVDDPVRERTSVTPVGVDGSVRVAVGSPRSSAAVGRGAGPPPGPPPGPPAGRGLGPIS